MTSPVAPPGPGGRQHLAAPWPDAVPIAMVVGVTADEFAMVADHGMLIRIQRVDDVWLRLMISGRTTPLTATAGLFNLLELVYVTPPVRIAIAGLLALRRRRTRDQRCCGEAVGIAADVPVVPAGSLRAAPATVSRPPCRAVAGNQRRDRDGGHDEQEAGGGCG